MTNCDSTGVVSDGTDSKESIKTRAAVIRLLVLDVDGVLTDGRLYYTARGEEMKSFHVRDGSGIVQLLRGGVQVAIISGRKSAAVEYRAAELGISLVRQGIADKLVALLELVARLDIEVSTVACVGDDSADVAVMQAARLAIAVADAHDSVKRCAHFVTQAAGGYGAVREACDLILAARDATRSN